MALHWAEDSMADLSKTACGLAVGWILAETSDEVTSEDADKFLAEPQACADCKDSLGE